VELKKEPRIWQSSSSRGRSQHYIQLPLLIRPRGRAVLVSVRAPFAGQRIQILSGRPFRTRVDDSLSLLAALGSAAGGPHHRAGAQGQDARGSQMTMTIKIKGKDASGLNPEYLPSST
jgi:hypothetical protein